MVLKEALYLDVLCNCALDSSPPSSLATRRTRQRQVKRKHRLTKAEE
jgi:hypothetical protein